VGVFIEVTVKQMPFEVGQELLQLCPVNIFQLEDGQLRVVPENEDECTLCELCLDTAPPDAIRIKKLYKDETLISKGKAHG